MFFRKQLIIIRKALGGFDVYLGDILNELREETPTPLLRDKVNDGIKFPIDDPAIPGKTAVMFEADHIVSMDRITRMENFEKLTKDEMRQVLNYEKNFTGLSKSANTSKGSKTFAEWAVYKKENLPINQAYRDVVDEWMVIGFQD